MDFLFNSKLCNKLQTLILLKTLVLLTFLLIVALMHTPAVAQQGPCKNKLEELLNKLSSTEPGNYARYMEYSTTSRLRIGTEQVSSHNSKARVYSHGKKLYYVADEMEVFQDGTETVLIMKDKQTVFLANVGKATDQQYNQLHIIKQQVLENILDLKCMQEDNEVIIALLPGDSLGHQVAKLVYRIDPAANQLRRIEVYYKPHSPLESTVLSFSKIDEKVNVALLPGSAASLLYDKEGELKPAYKRYQIIDHRKKISRSKNK
jgi:hypothetical protein